MKDKISRMCKMDDWIFEVKMVRALKVRKHGEPYTAVAHLTANGEQIYIDSQLAIDNEDFSREDFKTICRFCESMGMKFINYDRYKNGIKTSKVIDLKEEHRPKPDFRLIK